MATAPGGTFRKYTLIERLGEGGSSEVWKGWDPELKRFVAIKFLRSSREDQGRRLLREAETAARLDHPGIVPIYEAGLSDQTYFVVMRYIEGPTLGKAELSTRGKIEAVRDAARALDFAHSKGVIHRDVKPDNIMIEKTGGKVYVADFGLAKQHEVDTSLSVSGAVIGTAQYMPPEQAQGNAQSVDARSDVYSLGATLYELLSGRPPFDGNSFFTVVMSVIKDDPAPPRKYNPEVPEDLSTILLKALEKAPDRRYSTAAEFADDLQRFLDGEPIRARQATWGYRCRRALARHRWVALSIAATFLAGLVFGGYVFVSAASLRAQKARALSDAERAEREGRWEDAMAGYERASALDPSDATLHPRKEDMARRVGDEREKLKAAARLAREKQQADEVYLQAERELHLLRARSYRADWRLSPEELADFETLIRRCQEQMKKTGETGAGWWVVGRAQHALGNWRAAEISYDAGLKAQPGHPWCMLHKSRLLIERAILERFKTGRQDESHAESEQRMKEAMSLLEKAVAGGEIREIELDLAKGYALVVTSEPAEAFCAEQLKKWQGKDFREEFLLIRGLGTPARLVADTTEAIRARPSFADAYFWRGVGRRSGGDLEGAFQDWTKAIAINPRYTEAYHTRGHWRFAIREYAKAIEDLTRALEIDPANSDVYTTRGITRLAMNDVDGAIADHDKAIELSPGSAEAHYNRGNARIVKRDVPGAMADWARCIELDPRNGGAYINRGSAYYVQGDVSRAMADYDKGLELNPRISLGYFNRGIARVEQGDLAGGIDDLSKAIELDSNYAAAFFRRAVALEALARKEPALSREHLGRAVKDLERALQLAGPSSPLRAPFESAYRRISSSLEKARGEY